MMCGSVLVSGLNVPQLWYGINESASLQNQKSLTKELLTGKTCFTMLPVVHC